VNAGRPQGRPKGARRPLVGKRSREAASVGAQTYSTHRRPSGAPVNRGNNAGSQSRGQTSILASGNRGETTALLAPSAAGAGTHQPMEVRP